MRKKFLAVVLAVAVAFTTASVIPANTGVVKAAEKPASSLSAITTKPVASYTFDDATGLQLSGEAKVADGVLNLATTSDSFGKTYAQIADLSSYDFSKGFTLTADVKVTAYASDWTPIFMFGDGTIGGSGADATAVYHFSQGFSSVNKDFVGYFGSGISAPYTWDYYKNESSQNQWDTLTVTATKDTMTTYINGVQVQTATGDYTAVLDAFKVAKNNFLGASYWPADPDFAGSLDNVAVYNSALSAKEVSAIANGSTTTVTKKTMKIASVKAKTGATKVTGNLSVSGATVKVKVGSAAYKKATVKGKTFTLKTAKLKKGTKVTVTATKTGYKTVTKTVKVK